MTTSAFSAPDPLIERVNRLLLPELTIQNMFLEVAVESLTALANRALAASDPPVSRTFSCPLMVLPATRATLVNLRTTVGMTLGDALAALAQQVGCAMVWGALGVLICPWEVYFAIDRLFTLAESQQEQHVGDCTGGMELPLELVSKCPAFAFAGTEAQDIWWAWFRDAGEKPEMALSLADDMLGKHGEYTEHYLAEVMPLYLPPEPPPPAECMIPGLPPGAPGN